MYDRLASNDRPFTGKPLHDIWRAFRVACIPAALLAAFSLAAPADAAPSDVYSNDPVGPAVAAGKEIEAILPAKHINHILLTAYTPTESQTKFPPESRFLDPLNKILEEQKTFSDLTRLPEGAELIWRGYIAPEVDHVLRVDCYFGKDGARVYVITDQLCSGILLEQLGARKILQSTIAPPAQGAAAFAPSH